MFYPFIGIITPYKPVSYTHLRTEGISSTQLREEVLEKIKIGIIGTGRIAQRFIPEAASVSGSEIVSVYNPDYVDAEAFASRFGLDKATDCLLYTSRCV